MDRGRLGPFALEEQLGDAQSSAYRAIHLQQRKQMAVRIVTPAVQQSGLTVEEFAKEADFLKTLEHPGVVRCFGAGMFDDEAYLVSELIRGESLDAVLARRGKLPWDTVVEYAVQMCQALEYVHQRGTLHLHLSPTKAIVGEDGKIKLAGFLGSRMSDTGRTSVMERPESQLACTAPELFAGKPSPNQQTDLYSLGCIFFQMLTGQSPFQAEGAAAWADKHQNHAPPRITTLEMDCPVWLESIVAQLLEKQRGKRPHFASVVAVALVETREKVQARTSVAQHAVSGRSSALQAPEKSTDVKRLVRRKSTKQVPASPVYERPWFLVLCVLLLLVPVVWAFWPASEAQLFAKAERLMAGDDRAQWLEAEKQFQQLLERFPQGEHAKAAQAYLDRIDIDQAEAKLRINQRLGREGKTEGERRYVEAKKYEDFGDRLTALERYRKLTADLKDSAPDRPFVKLAAREANRLAALKLAETDRAAAVAAQLDEADARIAAGDALEARQIWNRIVSAYVDHPDLTPLVERARDRLAGKRPDPEASKTAPSP